MKHSTKQFWLGLFPLVVGIICNYLIFYLPASSILINIPYLALWGYLCYRLAIPQKNTFIQVFHMGIIGAFMLALVLYQELIRGAYFSGFLGLVGQFYFLPGMSIWGIFLTPFLEVLRPCYFYLAEYLGMTLISLGACALKRKKCLP